MNIIEKKIKNNIFNDIDDMDEMDEIDEIDEMDYNDYIDNYETSSKKRNKKFDLFKPSNLRPSCGIIVIDNFYINAIGTREYILTQDFSIKGNFPGQRTISYANENLKEILQSYISPFHNKITDFPCPKQDNSDAATIYNGSFQYTTSIDRSWIHTDKWNNWAGIVFLTPNAPLSSGTGFYKFKDNGICICNEDSLLVNQENMDRFSQDLTKWELVDRIGNVFNRLVLFDANRYHMSMDYFGDCKENGRLFQVFFFSAE